MWFQSCGFICKDGKWHTKVRGFLTLVTRGAKYSYLSMSLLMSVTVENIHQKVWYRWLTPAILAPGRLRQEFLKFKASLCYRNTISKRKKITIKLVKTTVAPLPDDDNGTLNDRRTHVCILFKR